MESHDVRTVSFVTPWPDVSDKNAILFRAKEQLVARLHAWVADAIGSGRRAHGEFPTVTCGSDLEVITDAPNAPHRQSLSLSAEIDDFFSNCLAQVIQERESDYVNVMSDCIRSQLFEKQQQMDALQHKLNATELENTNLRAKLDRRIAERDGQRKEHYKQIVMLKELVANDRRDPRLVRVLDEVMTANSFVRLGAPISNKSDRIEQPVPSQRLLDHTSNDLRREKERLEKLAEHATVENQRLREQTAALTHELEEMDWWFMTPHGGIQLRQRVIEAVYRTKCSWESVGASVVEFLNSDLIWQAVENSARVEKDRIPRGFEALLLRVTEMERTHRLSQHDQAAQSPHTQISDLEEDHQSQKSVAQVLRRLPIRLSSQMVPCHICDGIGYIYKSGSGRYPSETTLGSESYLRKTLTQVLELKRSLDDTTHRKSMVETQLQTVLASKAMVEEQLDRVTATRRSAQTKEVQVNMDEVDAQACIEDLGEGYNRLSSSRAAKCNAHYESFIIELKNEVYEQSATIVTLREALAALQQRLVDLHRGDFLEKQPSEIEYSMSLSDHKQSSEITSLKPAVDLQMHPSVQATEIDELTFEPHTERSSTVSRLSCRSICTGGEGDMVNEYKTQSRITNKCYSPGVVTKFVERSTAAAKEMSEVLRAELMVRRYSEAVIRVQQELQRQKTLSCLVEARDEEKRKMTVPNTVVVASDVVMTVSSGAKELFKALTASQNELANVRRASQRTITVQTDRIMTLTTHLSHLSEELCMIRKRALIDAEFWELESKKTHTLNETLRLDNYNLRTKLLEVQGHSEEQVNPLNTPSFSSCVLCDKHTFRATAIISDEMMKLQGHNKDVADAATQIEKKKITMAISEMKDAFEALSRTEQQQLKLLLLPFDSSDMKPEPAIHRIDTIQVLSSPTSRSTNHHRQHRASSIGANRQVDFARLQAMECAASNSRGCSTRTKSQLKDEQAANSIVLVAPSGESEMSQDDVAAAAPFRNDLLDSLLKTEMPRPVELDPSTTSSPIGSQVISRVEMSRTAPSDPCHQSPTCLGSVNDAPIPIQPALSVVQEDATIIGIKEAVTDEQPTDKDLHRDAPEMELDQQRHGQANQEDAGDLNDRENDVDRESALIKELNSLFQRTRAIKHQRALTNWKILLFSFRTMRDAARLEVMKVEASRTYSESNKSKPLATERNRCERERKSFSIRSTMQKLLRFREDSLDATFHEQEEFRQNYVLLHDRLIQTATLLLVEIDRANCGECSISSPTRNSPRPSSAGRSRGPYRFHYPSSRINLGTLPASQKIPTAHFPLNQRDDDSTLQAAFDVGTSRSERLGIAAERIESGRHGRTHSSVNVNDCLSVSTHSPVLVPEQRLAQRGDMEEGVSNPETPLSSKTGPLVSICEVDLVERTPKNEHLSTLPNARTPMRPWSSPPTTRSYRQSPRVREGMINKDLTTEANRW